MIENLRLLRDLLEAIDRGFDDPEEADPTLMDQAMGIVETLLYKHEKPDPVKPNACMRLPTPPAPPPAPVKQPRPDHQRPQVSKPRVRKPKARQQEEAA